MPTSRNRRPHRGHDIEMGLEHQTQLKTTTHTPPPAETRSCISCATAGSRLHHAVTFTSYCMLSLFA
ncbi:hypothetical protein YC2023_033128 [Brassica napus]